MSGRSPTAVRLFWTLVVGSSAGFWYGAPAFAATGTACLAILAHRFDRPRRFRALVRRIARRHGSILALRRRQERFRDAYGNTIEDGWRRERAYFVERTVVPLLEERGFAEEAESRFETMLEIVERVACAQVLPEASDAPEDGVAYERFCAERLEEAGWRARPTGASGDQGCDVIAEQAGVRLVVQCKRYGRPVGNAAVQEVAAAAQHWSADMAAVVSNAGFTPAARKLAGTTGVLLLHHDALDDLEPRREPGRRRKRPAEVR
ncbi:restriction endonuclease [Methylobacterium sp. Leaf118]|uniref:restriction endonuclease n=1 Tax=Methylobacterium sp. Leaf118 TaxID=2876562 RepID=UPI001E51AC4A|nr:restriction endonuclease [Methylobacterium sp. Leaf118]